MRLNLLGTAHIPPAVQHAFRGSREPFSLTKESLLGRRGEVGVSFEEQHKARGYRRSALHSVLYYAHTARAPGVPVRFGIESGSKR